jgi:hypothetical protein
LPGGGEPSAVKSASCCASVLGLMGRFGLGRIIMNVLSSKRSAALPPLSHGGSIAAKEPILDGLTAYGAGLCAT